MGYLLREKGWLQKLFIVSNRQKDSLLSAVLVGHILEAGGLEILGDLGSGSMKRWRHRYREEGQGEKDEG
jgi:hypothetical protein